MLDHIKYKGIPAKQNIYFCFIDSAKDFDCVDHNKLWNILKEMGIPDNITCLPRNLYAGQEAKDLVREKWTGSNLEKEYTKAEIGTMLI